MMIKMEQEVTKPIDDEEIILTDAEEQELSNGKGDENE